MSLSKEFRKPQKEADEAIYVESLVNNKIIAKMFCATGKSLLMRKCKIAQNKNLLVYVFPSLSLIKQFCNDYFDKKDKSICLLKVSSDESGSTTDPAQIIKFLKKNTNNNKIICVTYQSYKTLLDNLGSTKINLCIYDEAHHAVAPKYQKYIFEDETNACEKQLFFTATPKDDNGVVMCDKVAGICGRTVYDYPYYQGLKDGYLNKFEIRVDMYTANTNYSIYESIARTILITGNNRVLTFHADVNTERNTSVLNFVNQTEFISAFNKVLKEEFPEKVGVYTKFKMIGLDASINSENRENILKKFDTTPDNEVYIISSCETIGEGIDTKNANMCVFVDPKSSYVKIIQNIGRIVRPQSKTSTVLIPCWVDKENYLDCGEDNEKRDEVIRADLINDRGNFNGILKVLSALRQEDEDLYDACLYYGEEIDDNNNNCVSVEDDSDSDNENNEDDDSDSEYDSEYDSEFDSDSEDDELPINPKFKINVKFHTSDDIKVLWKISSEIDIMKNMCSCVLDCEVDIVDKWFERFEELKSFIDENECLPIKIKNLITWVYTQTDNYKNNRFNMKDKIKYELWTQFMFDYKQYFKYYDGKWDDMLNGLKEYIDTNKKTPQRYLEPILYEWFVTQNQNYKNKNKGMKNEPRYTQWSKFIEDYKQYFRVYDGKWITQLNELKEFIDKHSTMPKKDTNQTLHSWFYTQKTNYKNQNKRMSDFKKRYEWDKFINDYKKYFNTFDDEWYQNYEKLECIIKYTKLLPNVKNNNFIYNWYHTQNKQYSSITHSMKDKKKYNLWKNFLEKNKNIIQSKSKIKEQWLINFEKLKEFIDSEKKRPTQQSKKSTERSLGIWLSRNIQQYKNKTKGMKDTNRYSQWSQFLEEYKQYFDNNSEDKSTEEPEVIEEEIIITPTKPKPKKSMKLKKPKQSITETTEQKRQRTKSEMEILHQKYKTMKSENLKNEFQENPELWHQYHAISEENEKSFPEESIPRNSIIQELDKIKTNRNKIVVDMGCGKAQISDHFANDKRFRFINYDHISSKENIEVQDISNIPLEENDVEICILCLAMWGSNCKEYIKEAYRILESGGNLYIIEATKRWSEKDENGIVIAGQEGAKLKNLLQESGFKIVCEKIEKFSYFKCTK